MRSLREFKGQSKDTWGTTTFKRESTESKKLGENVPGVGGTQENVIHCGRLGRRRISNVAERLSVIRIEMRDTMRLLWLVESEDSGKRRDLSKRGHVKQDLACC